ncbi:MAG: ATP-binding protein [Catenulispora sp.]|nr:ATP-binding protein [Catenulispora sp.]
MSYWSRSFPGLAECLAEVRQFTRMVVGNAPGSDLVVLAVSELAGNAIVHTASGEPGGQFVVHLAAYTDRWQVRVDDQGAPGDPRIVVAGVDGPGLCDADDADAGAGDAARAEAGAGADSDTESLAESYADPGQDTDLDLFLEGDWTAETGRGLALVAAVSRKWGVLGDCNARAVWAEIPYPVTNGKAVEAVMSGDMLDAFAAVADELAGDAGLPAEDDDFDATPEDDGPDSVPEREAAGLPAAASAAPQAAAGRWRGRVPTDPKVAERYRRTAISAMFQRTLIEHAHLETIGPRELPFWPPFPNPLALQEARSGQARSGQARSGQARTPAGENRDDQREFEGQEAG